jgi:hypothetical protein
VKAWNLILNKLKGKRVSSRLIARSLKKANLPSEVRGFSIEQVQKKLKQAYQEYYSNKHQAASLRNTSLDLLAEAIVVKGDLAREKVLRDLRQREQQRATARKLRFIQGKMKSESITMVTVVGEDGNRADITDRKEMEKAILDNNKAKFSQSFHTPFYRSPLKEAFGFQGLTNSAQAVLAGIYETDEPLDAHIMEVLQQWEKPDEVRQLGPMTMNLMLDQYRAFWNKANENTSCYPSALSFSTMKAGSYDIDISFVDWTLTKIPLERGFSPS